MDPSLKYLWQQPVSDALTEMNPDRQPQKIAAAQEAITARLCETPDAQERRALGSALTALQVMFPGKRSPDERL
jgi:hypothetical protein